MFGSCEQALCCCCRCAWGPDMAPLSEPIDPEKCLGDWYVQYGIPAVAAVEDGGHNGKEHYTMDPITKRVKVAYTFNEGSFVGKVNASGQIGRVASPNGTHWQTKPIIGGCTFPCWINYYVVDVDRTNYEYMTASAPGAWWVYVMTREQVVDDKVLEPRLELLRSKGIDMSKLRRMPQQKAGQVEGVMVRE